MHTHYTHTHTHTLCRLIGVKDNVAFEGRESSRVPDVLPERVFQIWGPKCEKVRKPWVLRLKRWSLSMRVSDEAGAKRAGRTVKV